MKKTTFILFVLLFSISIQIMGQKVGFQLGLNFSNWSSTEDTMDVSNFDPLISPSLGFLVDIPIQEQFFISTGVFTRVKGNRYEGWRPIGDVVNGDFEMKETREFMVLWYLSLPVNFGYQYELDNGMKLYGKTGPTFDFGLYTTNLYRYGSTWDNQKASFGDPADNFEAVYFYNSFDFGWNLEAGMQISRFQFSLFYNPGFSKVIYNDFEGAEEMANVKNYVYGFKTAILFGDIDSGGRSRRGSWRR